MAVELDASSGIRFALSLALPLLDKPRKLLRLSSRSPPPRARWRAPVSLGSRRLLRTPRRAAGAALPPLLLPAERDSLAVNRRAGGRLAGPGQPRPQLSLQAGRREPFPQPRRACKMGPRTSLLGFGGGQGCRSKGSTRPRRQDPPWGPPGAGAGPGGTRVMLPAGTHERPLLRALLVPEARKSSARGGAGGSKPQGASSSHPGSAVFWGPVHLPWLRSLVSWLSPLPLVPQSSSCLTWEGTRLKERGDILG